MSESLEKFEKAIRRKAIVLNVGGFHPPANPLCSWFGKVLYCSVGESWPASGGKPMLALAQINLNEFPYKPEYLDDISFITVFIDAKELPFDKPNGHGWVLRAYKTIHELVPVKTPLFDSPIKPYPMRATVVEPDYPCWADLPVDCPSEIEDQYYDLYDNISGFKFGGWPSLIQSEIF